MENVVRSQGTLRYLSRKKSKTHGAGVTRLGFPEGIEVVVGGPEKDGEPLGLDVTS